MNSNRPTAVQTDENFAQLEKQWVQQAKGGNEDAYKMLFEHYFPKMFGTIYQMVQNTTLAEDLTQATLVQAWRRLDRFDGRSAFGTWLYRVGINLTLDHLRRLKNRPHASLEHEAEKGFEIQDQTDNMRSASYQAEIDRHNGNFIGRFTKRFQRERSKYTYSIIFYSFYFLF